MQFPFGPQIVNPAMLAGPVAPVELPPGFRPPGLMGGGGLPSAPAQGGMSIGGIPTVPGLGMANRNPANKPPGMPAPNQYGVPDPEAMQSAYPGGPASIDETGAIKSGSNWPPKWLTGFFGGGSGLSGPTALDNFRG